MKGVVLAGGLGTRLFPITKNQNKHLLPVFDKRMIEIPIRTLVDAGVKEVVLVTGGHNPGHFLEILKNGKELGLEKLYYGYQEGQGGIVDALKIAMPFFSDKEPCMVILGDNYFESEVSDHVSSWDRTGSKVFLKEVENPQDFGVAVLSEGGEISEIEEKPEKPKSNFAILGCYLFDSSVWDFVDQVEPSKRKELEIVDVLKMYLECGKITYSVYSDYWNDMGTFGSLNKVAQRIAQL